VGSKRNIIQRIKEIKLKLFDHICRMEDNRLVKEVVFLELDGKTNRGRPHWEWLDDVKEWCNEDIHELKRKVQERDTHGNSQTCIGHQQVINLWNTGCICDAAHEKVGLSNGRNGVLSTVGQRTCQGI